MINDGSLKNNYVIEAAYHPFRPEGTWDRNSAGTTQTKWKHLGRKGAGRHR